MNRIELSVARIVGIEFKADKPACQELVDSQAVKNSGMTGQAIQVQIGGGLVRFPVQDVQRPVQVIDGDSPAPAGLLAEATDPRQ